MSGAGTHGVCGATQPLRLGNRCKRVLGMEFPVQQEDEMARAIWTGSVSFDLANLPVGLYSATQDHDAQFHHLKKGTSSRVRNQRVNEDTDEVDYSNVVTGAEVGSGGHVMLTQEEIEAVEPGRSRTIEISDFVDAAAIDPISYQKSYFLAPSDDSAEKAYALAKATDKAQRIVVATFVTRGKQYLAAIRPSNATLLLETMYFADEARDPAGEIDNLPATSPVRGKDLDMAVCLGKSLTTDWDPKDYRDTSTGRVEQLIDANKMDREVVLPETAGEREERASSVLEALQACVDAAKSHRRGNAANVVKLQARKREADTDTDTDTKASKKSTAKMAKKTTAKRSTSKKAPGGRSRKAS